ncbi:hypothetical protein HN51_024909 [Arachis hypogaea]|uniref:Exocyst subunit Exo70 family protein n=1 Tax=Arachis hypogaea TaxID=3818 RepID=A0A445C746_ARAHY|nr:exocyst complex component EXO70B1-like [Arachis hypogaea]QHO27820.1 Exocyst complex component [Arachis hypogaea]QHO27821.1 Exocyst complex component [Arachis hypogaea]RYR46752.1 hypothetical protein Ahy_A07g032548 [Arachis hypogaea]
MPTGSSLPHHIEKWKNWVLHEHEPDKWWIMSVPSAMIGLTCFAFSYFNHHLKAWNLMLKILISIVLIALICIAVLFARRWPNGSRPWVKAHLVLVAITVTYVATIFLDKEKEEEPDVLRLVSYAAFAVTSLSLAIQTQVEFFGEIVYFFVGLLLIGLMKINWWLAIFPGACFSYLLIILSSFLHELSEKRIPTHTNSSASPTYSETSYVENTSSIDYFGTPMSLRQFSNTDTETSFVDDTSSIGSGTAMNPQQSNNTDTGTVPLLAPPPVRSDDLLDGFRRALRTLNGLDRELAWELKRPLGDYLTDRSEEVPAVLGNDSNFLVDRISSQVLDELNRLMMNLTQFDDDLRNLVVDEYSRSRKRFLEICQVELQLNVHKKNTVKKWIKVSNITLRILFPNERRLCDRVFGSSSDIWGECFMQVCSEWARDLLNFADQVAKNGLKYQKRDYLPQLFQVLRAQCDLIIPSFELLFSNTEIRGALWTEAIKVKERLCRAIKDYFFMGLEDLAHADGRKEVVYCSVIIHDSTVQLMERLSDAFKERDTLGLILQDYPIVPVKEGMTLLASHISWMIDLLEANLETFTENSENASLGCVYLINNFSYIERKVHDTQLDTILGHSWLEEQSVKFQGYLEKYRRNSWDTVFGYLKLDSENVTEESMKEKIQLFNEHFGKMFYHHRRWSVHDTVRGKVRKSVSTVFVPEYGNFIERFREILGDHADEYIEYSTSEELEECFVRLFSGGGYSSDDNRDDDE